MKHTLKITLLLLGMFFITQLIGIGVAQFYSPVVSSSIVNGTTLNTTSYNLPYGMNPPAENTPGVNLVSIVISMALAILFILLLMKMRAELFFRIWFLFVISVAIAITTYAGLSSIGFGTAASVIAFVVAIPLAVLKVFRRGMLSHNFTELLIYPGIAAIIIPLLNIWTIVVFLVLISIYDAYAVWHAGFMQKMAKYQIQKVKVFAGFFVPYMSKKDHAKMQNMRDTKGKGSKNLKVNVAILGGGDVVFPCILSGVVLHTWGLLPAIIIAIGATAALALLFYYSKKGKFYPAMPFISAGCFVALMVAYFFR